MKEVFGPALVSLVVMYAVIAPSAWKAKAQDTVSEITEQEFSAIQNEVEQNEVEQNGYVFYLDKRSLDYLEMGSKDSVTLEMLEVIRNVEAVADAHISGVNPKLVFIYFEPERYAPLEVVDKIKKRCQVN